jgi:hypothetical protein
MASFNAYPPAVLHPSFSHSLDTSSAHKILSTFVRLANLDPAYRPDSTLTENGPQPTSSSGNPNLTLHHLNRIKLSLEGTNLGAEDLYEGFFGAKSTANKEHGRKRKWEEHRGGDVGSAPMRAGIPKIMATTEENVDAVITAQGADAKKASNTEGWQDREDFELAQDDEDDDMNNAQRDPAMALEMEGVGQEIMEGETGRTIDLDSEMDKEDGAAQAIRTGDVIDKQEAEGRNGSLKRRKLALNQEQRDERKKLKKTRHKEEKKRSDKGRVAEGLKEPSITKTPPRKKRKSKADVSK